MDHLKAKQIDINYETVKEAVLEDVMREGKGEIPNNKQMEKAIKGEACTLYKKYLEKLK